MQFSSDSRDQYVRDSTFAYIERKKNKSNKQKVRSLNGAGTAIAFRDLDPSRCDEMGPRASSKKMILAFLDTHQRGDVPKGGFGKQEKGDRRVRW